jgi:hypothetical protein
LLGTTNGGNGVNVPFTAMLLISMLSELSALFATTMSA